MSAGKGRETKIGEEFNNIANYAKGMGGDIEKKRFSFVGEKKIERRGSEITRKRKG